MITSYFFLSLITLAVQVPSWGFSFLICKIAGLDKNQGGLHTGDLETRLGLERSTVSLRMSSDLEKFASTGETLSLLPPARCLNVTVSHIFIVFLGSKGFWLLD